MSNKEKLRGLLSFLKGANQLKMTQRYLSTLNHVGDSVAEHSWRLSMMTFLFAHHFDIKVNVGRAMQIALIHDLPEAKTGDIDAYDQIKKRFSKKKKVADENKALDEIRATFCFEESMIQELWSEYVKQSSLEAKFVKALDKLEALLHLATIGVKEHYKQPDFYSNYANKYVHEFDKSSGNAFPVLSVMLDLLKSDLKKQFKLAGVKWLD